MRICQICAAKVRLAFPRRELKEVGESEFMACGHCRKKRHCAEYEFVEKEREQ